MNALRILRFEKQREIGINYFNNIFTTQLNMKYFKKYRKDIENPINYVSIIIIMTIIYAFLYFF